MRITTTETPLDKALQYLGVYRFEHKSYNPKRNAGLNLKGRTHYVDDETLSYWKAKILASDTDASGLLFYLVESVPDYEGKREKRVVIFDVFGQVLEKIPCSSSLAGIQLAEDYFSRIIPENHTLHAIRERANIQAHRAAKALECLEGVQ